MKHTRLLLSCLFILFIIPVNGQYDKKFKQYFTDAQYYLITENYQEALKYYQKLLYLDPSNCNIHYLTGTCYLNIPGMKTMAIKHFEAANMHITQKYRDGSYREKDAPFESIFYLARAYHINSEFDKAIDHYIEYRNNMYFTDFAAVEYVNKQIEACELAKEMIRQPLNVQFVKLEGYPINYEQNNYRGVVSEDQSTMLFMSDKPYKNAIHMTQNLDGTWSEVKVINKELGDVRDCQTASLSTDGKTLLLVKSDPFNADIYISYYKDGHWSEIQKLPRHINTVYYESHAYLSSDGSTLYFTSNRKGGYGALDIYTSQKIGDNDWDSPENLGSVINTPYNEETPFLTEDRSMLFFSSQGHTNMGGYDIFVSERLPDGSWSVPENVGYPVNGPDDETFYVPVNNGQGALFAMAGREGNGQVGLYNLKYIPEQPSELLADNFVATVSQREKTPKELVLEMEAGSEVHGAKAGEYLVVKNIMFEFDKYSLDEKGKKDVERLYTIMKQYPDLSVEVVGHSDAMGTEVYNLELSMKRANSVVSYLSGKGIDKSRFISKGVGEEQSIAINQNPDGTDNPEGRKYNRNAEIRLINYENEKITVEEVFVPEDLRPKTGQRFLVLLANPERRDLNIPKQIKGNIIHEIKTDESYLYTIGNYEKKTDAVDLLNSLVDDGYPDVAIMEKHEIDRLIIRQTKVPLLSGSKYTIQILAMSQPLDVDYFMALKNVLRFLGDDGIYRYVVGEFGSPEDALKSLPGVKAIGYPDAYVMNLARYNGILADKDQ
jgi:outer membrane protein OmpA-like peptidoglycan-associated protein/tetratricopeptide (TPR) repeat protein